MVKEDAKAMETIFTMNTITQFSKDNRDDRDLISKNAKDLFENVYQREQKSLDFQSIVKQLVLCSSNPRITCSVLDIMTQFNILFSRLAQIQKIPMIKLKQQCLQEWDEMFDKLKLDLSTATLAMISDSSSESRQAILAVLKNQYGTNAFVNDTSILSSEQYKKAQKMYYDINGLDEHGQPKPIVEKSSNDNTNNIPGLDR